MEKMSNEEVLELVGEDRSLIKIVRQRQLRFIGHVMRQDSLQKLCLQGRLQGNRSKDRQRTLPLQSLALAAGVSVQHLCVMMTDRDGLRKMVTNVRL